MLFWSLTGQKDGTTPYSEVSRLQKLLVELRSRDLVPDTILFLEHEPVITRGKGLQRGSDAASGGTRHMPLPPMLPGGITVADSERGGDLTYHGPGQLVIYPICKLDGSGFGPDHDVNAYIRRLERLLVEELAELALRAEGRDNATGVWVGDRKVASIGIAIRKWVTYHGIAINVVNDLSPFHLISPCGFSPEVMARLMDIVPDFESRIELSGAADWREWLEKALAERIAELTADDEPVHSFEVERLALAEAMLRAEKLAAENGLVPEQDGDGATAGLAAKTAGAKDVIPAAPAEALLRPNPGITGQL